MAQLPSILVLSVSLLCAATIGQAAEPPKSAQRPVDAKGAPPIPGKEIFDARLREVGTKFANNIIADHADWVANGNQSAGALNIYAEQSTSSYYYDATESLYWLAKYFGTDAPFKEAAWKSLAVVDGAYYKPNGYRVPGYKHFVRGPWVDYRERKQPHNLEILRALRDKPAFSDDGSFLAPPNDPALPPKYHGSAANNTKERELAYHLAALIYCDRAGIAPPRPERRTKCVQWSYDYLRYWFEAEGWKGFDEQVAPFMMGLVARVLIEDWEDTADKRLVPALRLACDYLWRHAYDAPSQSLYYNFNPDGKTAGGIGQGAPDLNMLIAPMYAWVAVQDRSQTQMDRADLLFAGMATNGWLNPGKHFNQQTTWLSAYFAWREQFYSQAGGKARAR